jgi:hypothetical protein
MMIDRASASGCQTVTGDYWYTARVSPVIPARLGATVRRSESNQYGTAVSLSFDSESTPSPILRDSRAGSDLALASVPVRRTVPAAPAGRAGPARRRPRRRRRSRTEARSRWPRRARRLNPTVRTSSAWQSRSTVQSARGRCRGAGAVCQCCRGLMISNLTPSRNLNVKFRTVRVPGTPASQGHESQPEARALKRPGRGAQPPARAPASWQHRRRVTVTVDRRPGGPGRDGPGPAAATAAWYVELTGKSLNLTRTLNSLDLESGSPSH